MKFILLIFVLIINSFADLSVIYDGENDYFNPNCVYRILSLSSNKYFNCKNKKPILSFPQLQFQIINKYNNYYIQTKRSKSYLGINDNNIIIFYNNIIDINYLKISWKLIKVSDKKFIIKNLYNNKFIEDNNNFLQCVHIPDFSLNNKTKFLEANINFIFDILKLYELGFLKKDHINIVNKEPIDIIIKYIDLYDQKLNRIGISQIKKDFDNEELRYSVRSILKNIPWIRRIYILMPNEKVRFFKSIDEIKEKIVYIKDKDLLGFDSANNPAFLFNLYKMEKFGASKNFIYMDDDYFIGKKLKKSDFFYYDENKKTVIPYIISNIFSEMNKTFILGKFNELFKMKDLFQPHSGKAFWLQTYSGEKYFIDHYNNISLIYTEFTHNAIPENTNELKEIYEEAKNYEYFNETINSRERYILTLTHQHFVNLYHLNIKKKKVHFIKWKYISIENINRKELNSPLFVINTGGSHIPLIRHYKKQKKVLDQIFRFKIKYEIVDCKKIIINNIIKKTYFNIFKIFTIMFFSKAIFSKQYLNV